MTDDDVDGGADSLADAAVVPRQRPVETFASGGESLLYCVTRDEASALNRTATEIWELCDGTNTVGAIARVLGQRYGVDDVDLVADVMAAVTALRARGLVDVAGAAGDSPA